MGCGNSKQKQSIRTLRLTAVGVRSVDRLVDQFEEVINRFAEVTDLLDDRKQRLDDITRFWTIRGARLKHSVLGILLQCFALANGDMSKVSIDVIERAPII